MAGTRDSLALVGFVGLDSSLNIHYFPHSPEVVGLVFLPDSMIHMTFVAGVAKVVMNMVVGY
jgi:hypothetical protein